MQINEIKLLIKNGVNVRFLCEPTSRRSKMFILIFKFDNNTWEPLTSFRGEIRYFKTLQAVYSEILTISDYVESIIFNINSLENQTLQN
ncbi:hypothetical protein CCP3SC1AL1_1590010 [Gammaproteobacteria bacterium]